MIPGIAEALQSVRASLPESVELVAVSKFHPVEALQAAYDAGQRIFGESRVQELLVKIPALPADIRWHFIGHLQSKKVRQLLATRSIALIESVDSEKLLGLIDSESERLGITTNVLVQVHVAREPSKFGFLPDELLQYFRDRRFESLKATHICGVMGMATNTMDRSRIADDFAAIAGIKKEIERIAPDLRGFDIISMGMSHDYPAAVAAGSTHVRIGTAIFGER